MGKTKKVRSQEWYRRKAVSIAKRLAKERDGYVCQFCGATRETRQIHASHILSDSAHKNLSAMPENIIALCAIHHSVKYSGSWHEDPVMMIEWFDKKYPGLRKRLIKKSLVTPLPDDWSLVVEKLKQKGTL